MKTKKSLNRPTEKGQSLVELAISLTFILILLAGAIHFGIGLFYYTAMRDAAQEGALYGSMNPNDNAGIQNRVENAAGAAGLIHNLAHPPDPGDPVLTTTVTYSGVPPYCEGMTITVTLEYNFPVATSLAGSFLKPFIGGSDFITLRAVAIDTILTPAC